MAAQIKTTGVRPHPSYGNPLDQRRYIYVLDKVCNKKVLDLASGVGWGSFLMASAGAYVTGVDESEDAVKFSNSYYNHKNLHFRVGTSSNLRSSEEKFDIITCFETIEHTSTPSIFLTDLLGCCHDQSLVFLSTPNSKLCDSVGTVPHNPFHIQEYTKTEIIQLCEDSGFSVDQYLGQYPIETESEDFRHYNQFIASYWKKLKLQNRYGLPYKILRRLLAGKKVNQNDPAWDDPAIQPIDSSTEPVYHYLILKPNRN